MLSNEFEAYFFQLRNLFLGCFSADNYPKKVEENQFFIVNKQSSLLRGSHWMLVLRIENNIEFFDSCGTSEEFVKEFLSFNSRFLCDFNETQLQPSHSITCGEFCIYFAHYRILNRDQSFESCINDAFSDDVEKNNVKVLKYCKNLKENGINQNNRF